MKLKRVGFFRELRHGDRDGPSLAESRRDDGDEFEAQVVQYLLKGITLVGCPGVVGDVLDETDPVRIPPHVMTDGEWAWSNDLVHYVRKYHVALDGAFIQHLNSRGFRPPEECDVDISTLSL